MGDSTEYTFRKLEDNKPLGGVAGRPDGCAATQRVHFSSLSISNTLMKFKKGKCKALPLRRAPAQTGSQPAEKQLCRERPGSPGRH